MMAPASKMSRDSTMRIVASSSWDAIVTQSLTPRCANLRHVTSRRRQHFQWIVHLLITFAFWVNYTASSLDISKFLMV